VSKYKKDDKTWEFTDDDENFPDKIFVCVLASSGVGPALLEAQPELQNCQDGLVAVYEKKFVKRKTTEHTILFK
jgi:hypothetical protein